MTSNSFLKINLNPLIDLYIFYFNPLSLGTNIDIYFFLEYDNSLVPLEMRNKAVSLSFTFIVHLTMNNSYFDYIFILVFFFLSNKKSETA